MTQLTSTPVASDSHQRRHAKVLTVSDGVHHGVRGDLSGAALVERLAAAGFHVVDHKVTHDGIEPVAEMLIELCDGFTGLIVTTGGTGFGPRDLTPEGTLAVLDRQAPGLAEAMRLVSPFGRLSRGVAGTRNQTLILNTPGSTKGAVESIEAVLDVLGHALDLLSGVNTPHPTVGAHCSDRSGEQLDSGEQRDSGR